MSYCCLSKLGLAICRASENIIPEWVPQGLHARVWVRQLGEEGLPMAEGEESLPMAEGEGPHRWSLLPAEAKRGTIQYITQVPYINWHRYRFNATATVNVSLRFSVGTIQVRLLFKTIISIRDRRLFLFGRVLLYKAGFLCMIRHEAIAHSTSNL